MSFFQNILSCPPEFIKWICVSLGPLILKGVIEAFSQKHKYCSQCGQILSDESRRQQKKNLLFFIFSLFLFTGSLLFLLVAHYYDKYRPRSAQEHYELGKGYAEGIRMIAVKRNGKQAVWHWEQAAALGHPDAQDKLKKYRDVLERE